MPVSHEHQCIFVHIPKTGGSSVEHLLGVFRDWRNEDRDCLFGLIQSPDILKKQWVTRFLQHLSIHEIAELLSSYCLNQYFSFSWVRNPWDRMVSIYSNKDPDMLAMAANLGLDLTKLGFSDFVDQTRDLFHVHLLDQSRFITDKDDRIAVNFVGRFERYTQDMNFVCSKLGIISKIPHMNISTRGNYRDYYNDHTIAEISKRYEIDIDLFGYTF